MLKPAAVRHGSVLVSGASSGIGLCCAQMLAEAGFHVFAGYRNEADAARLEAAHPNICPIPLDVAVQDSIQNALTLVQAGLFSEKSEKGQGNGLVGLVNNAGIAVGGPLEFLPVDALRHQLEVNVVGQVALTQAMLPLLREARGRIVNMGSIAGLSALPFVGPYSASKHALEALTDALRVELRPWGIHVSIIEPGVIATPIWDKSLAAANAIEPQFPPRLLALYGQVLDILKLETQKAARRGIAPQHVGRAVLHALSASRPRTRYVVGWDARLRLLFNHLPDRWQDWLIVKKVGFPG